MPERRAQSEAGAARRPQSEAGTITDVRGETPARGVSTFWRAARFPLLAKCGVFINVETPLAGVSPGRRVCLRHAYGRQTGASGVRAPHGNVETPLAGVLYTGVKPGRHACPRHAYGRLTGSSGVRAPHDNVETPLAGVLYTGVMPGRRVCARLACLRHAYGRQTGASCVRASSRRAPWIPARL